MITRLLVALAVLSASTAFATTTFAQSARQIRGASPYVAIEKEPPPKLIVDAPIAEGLARGVFWAQYRVENVRIVNVFGPGALDVSPRVGHLHVTVDDLPWWWADASDNNTVDIAGLPPGNHKVKIELVDASHKVFEGQAVTLTFSIPEYKSKMLHHGNSTIVPTGGDRKMTSPATTKAAPANTQFPGRPNDGTENDTIRPFRVNIPDADLADLRRRIEATRWPSKELVKDRSQGVQLATLKALAQYWTTEYDWRKAEAKLNALPQFVTKIDGVDIHFIHVKSQHENALPLIMTHGWPGSVIELLETVGPLTDPTKHGGTASDAFHLVLPSLPGYGFSGEPTELGWDSERIARAWAKLMQRLGYTRYVAQGGDVGASVTDAMGRHGPEGLKGIHLSLLAGALGIADKLPAKTEEERAAHAALSTFKTSGFGYFLEQSTRPQTIGYSLLDSPIGLAGWMLDHDTDSYNKISRAFVDRAPVGRLDRETIVDNITLYWLTGTGASAARWYWEFGQFVAAATAAGGAPPPVKVPVAFTTFPGEIWAAPRSWIDAVYPGVAYFNRVERGGHFAAWEEPTIFVSELRAAFKPLR